MEPAAPSPLILDEAGQPRSSLYGDIYFSTADGLAEARAVFLEGCALPSAWMGRRRFVVGELGFGTGLNILALLDLWRTAAPAGGRLHIFSIEAHPLDQRTAAGVLAAWPELSSVAGAVLDQWPEPARGFHRLDLPQFSATLDLAIMEAADALGAWTGQADAWFLDGFSPALNPQMWRQEVLDLVAQRAAPDARLATFTVAGAVRRGLQSSGFDVEKKPGFGRKRERLEARRPTAAPSAEAPPAGRVAVIGGGIAGAAMARALAADGVDVALYEAVGVGAGASGNPVALVTPRLDAGLGAQAELFSQALRRAVRLYDQVADAVLRRGVLQLARQPRDEGRFATIAQSDLFAAHDMRPLDGAQASAWLGEPAGPGLAQEAACVVQPAAILSAWLPAPSGAGVSALEPTDDGWRLLGPDGEVGRAANVVICAGPAARQLADLPLAAVRGQISIAPGIGMGGAAAWGGYLAPTPDGLVFGATHDRGDEGVEVRSADHARNLETLADAFPTLAGRVGATQLTGRAAVRAVTPDRLPLAGAIGPGLFVLGGLGARGFCLAPLLGEHVASMITGAPSPLPHALAELVDPDRFRRRAARRGS